MSFSQDVRSSGNFQELFGRLRRRINKNEISKDDLATLQRHVNNMRTQIDWATLIHITDNLASNPIGPNDFVFEPDLTEVMLYNPFANVFGDGVKLDKTLNGTAYDVIEIGDGTFIPSTVSTGTYHYQPYKNFNLVSDALQIADDPSLDLTQFSLACWFRTSHDYADAEGYIILKGFGFWQTDADTRNYFIKINNDPFANEIEAGFQTNGSGGFVHFVATDFTVNDGQWHHVVLTYDQITIRLYMDGVEVDNWPNTNTPGTNARELYIGADPDEPTSSSKRVFHGDIDQVYVWNNDLTAGEVSALYSAGTVPQTSAIVYQNDFGGTTNTTALKKCYYAVPDGTASWDWNVGHHPPSMKSENSLALNISGTSQQQFLYYDEFGTDFDFTGNNLSFGFWIYPTVIPTVSNKSLMARRLGSNDTLRVEIDDADGKVFGQLKIGGVESNREVDLALAANNWYYINGTCEFAGPTLSLKVNDNADTASSKGFALSPNDDKLYFGGFAGMTETRFYEGYLAFPMWYKHSTVLTTAERTSLYNYNTKTSTTEPFIFGFGQFG